MIETALVEAAMNDLDFATLIHDIGRIFGRSVKDIYDEYYAAQGLTTLHEILLRVDLSDGTLEDYLLQITAQGTILDLINATDGRGRSVLAWTVAHGWTAATAILVNYGADVNQSTASSSLPLLHRAIAGPANGELQSEFMKIVELLLNSGADINATDLEGWTPLHIAASWNSRQAVTTLSTYDIGLNWTAVTGNGKSAPQLARPRVEAMMGSFNFFDSRLISQSHFILASPRP